MESSKEDISQFETFIHNIQKTTSNNELEKFQNFIKEVQSFQEDNIYNKFNKFIEDTKQITKIDYEQFFKELREKVKDESVSIMKIYGISRVEINHSNFLSWILNPNENHGFGDKFLREFLKMASTKTISDFENVKVKREVKREESISDIVISNENFCCVIENKVKSGLGYKQLERLTEDFENEINSGKFIGVYLTPPKRDNPKHKNFKHITYKEIRDILNGLKLDEKEDNKVKIVINDYIDNLEANILAEFKGFSEASKKYIENYETVDKVRKEFEKQRKNFLEAIDMELKKSFGEDWKIDVESYWMDIYKNDWHKKEKEGKEEEGGHFYISLYMDFLKDNEFEIGFYTLPTNREKFYKILEEEKYKTDLENLKKKGYTINKKGAYHLRKTFPLGKDDEILKKTIEELNNLISLMPYIDKTIEEMSKK